MIHCKANDCSPTSDKIQQEGLAVASIARDDPSTLAGDDPSTTMHGRDLKPSYNAPMHFRHRQMDRQTDTDIVA